MGYISESKQKDKLKKLGINIKTKYICDGKVLERNSDDSYNDDIDSGIRIKKEYYKKNRLILKESSFDTRNEYTYISKELENKEYTCPNCGNHSIMKELLDGCPYCGTYYNIDYTSKDLGGKYHYDRVLRSNTYRILTAVFDLIISFILVFIFLKITSRTFNFVDISKVVIYSLILSLILYYFFYILDAYIILEPIKKYKDKKNKEMKDFLKNNIDEPNIFFNNFNYELRNKLYNNSDIIDYDILDYDEISGTNSKVEVKVYIRIVRMIGSLIKSSYEVNTYTLIRNEDTLKVNNKENIMQCPSCGASLDITKGKCEYCNYVIKSITKWIIK